ncbi:MAG: hypothetical protein Q4G58_01410 [bacterium]|nr:hypothetical protein [bacterium]
MIKIFKAELYKIVHLTSMKTFILLTILAFGGGAFVPVLFSATSVKNYLFETSDIFSFIIIIMVVSLTILDYNAKTMKNIVSSGVSLPSIYLARMLSIFVMVAVTLLVAMVAGGIGAYIKLGGMGEGDVTVGTGISLVESYFLQLIYLIGIACITHLVTTLFRNTVLSLVVSLGLSICGNMINALIEERLKIDLSGYSLPDVLDSIDKMSLSSDFFLHFGVVTGGILIICSLLGIFVFNKRSLA